MTKHTLRMSALHKLAKRQADPKDSLYEIPLHLRCCDPVCTLRYSKAFEPTPGDMEMEGPNTPLVCSVCHGPVELVATKHIKYTRVRI